MELDDNAKRILKKIVERHKKDVALLFKQYGFSAPVSEETVVKAFLANQGKFVDDLISLGISEDPEIIPDLDIYDEEDLDESFGQESFLGIGKAGSPNKGRKLAAVFNNIGKMVTGIKILGKAAKNTSNENKANAKEEEEIINHQDKKILGIPSSIFYGSAVVVVLVAVLLLMNHYKKN